MNEAVKARRREENLAIGAWFRARREASGMSVTQVAGLLGMTRSAVSQMELGGMTLRTAGNHAETLGWGRPTLKDVMNQQKGADFDLTPDVIKIPYLQLPNDKEMLTHEEILVPFAWLEQYLPHTDPKSLAFRRAPAEQLTADVYPNSSLLFDTSINSLEGTGIYAITYQGLSMIRQLVYIGDGAWEVCTRERTEITISKEDAPSVIVHARAKGKFLGFFAL